MKIKNIFRKKNKYASPYYGSNGALFNSSAVPLRLEQQPEQEAKQKIKASQLPPPPDPRPTEPDWEQRRFELVSRLMCQERRSVILGKLQATPKQIATNLTPDRLEPIYGDYVADRCKEMFNFIEFNGESLR